jgi:hypothetical protein
MGPRADLSMVAKEMSLYIFNSERTNIREVFLGQHRTVGSRYQDCAVGIAAGNGLDGRGVGVRILVGSRIFSMSSRPALGPTQPPIK